MNSSRKSTNTLKRRPHGIQKNKTLIPHHNTHANVHTITNPLLSNHNVSPNVIPSVSLSGANIDTDCVSGRHHTKQKLQIKKKKGLQNKSKMLPNLSSSPLSMVTTTTPSLSPTTPPLDPYTAHSTTLIESPLQRNNGLIGSIMIFKKRFKKLFSLRTQPIRHFNSSHKQLHNASDLNSFDSSSIGSNDGQNNSLNTDVSTDIPMPLGLSGISGSNNTTKSPSRPKFSHNGTLLDQTTSQSQRRNHRVRKNNEHNNNNNNNNYDYHDHHHRENNKRNHTHHQHSNNRTHPQSKSHSKYLPSSESTSTGLSSFYDRNDQSPIPFRNDGTIPYISNFSSEKPISTSSPLYQLIGYQRQRHNNDKPTEKGSLGDQLTDINTAANLFLQLLQTPQLFRRYTEPYHKIPFFPDQFQDLSQPHVEFPVYNSQTPIPGQRTNGSTPYDTPNPWFLPRQKTSTRFASEPLTHLLTPLSVMMLVIRPDDLMKNQTFMDLTHHDMGTTNTNNQKKRNKNGHHDNGNDVGDDDDDEGASFQSGYNENDDFNIESLPWESMSSNTNDGIDNGFSNLNDPSLQNNNTRKMIDFDSIKHSLELVLRHKQWLLPGDEFIFKVTTDKADTSAYRIAFSTRLPITHVYPELLMAEKFSTLLNGLHSSKLDLPQWAEDNMDLIRPFFRYNRHGQLYFHHEGHDDRTEDVQILHPTVTQEQIQSQIDRLVRERGLDDTTTISTTTTTTTNPSLGMLQSLLSSSPATSSNRKNQSIDQEARTIAMKIANRQHTQYSEEQNAIRLNRMVQNLTQQLKSDQDFLPQYKQLLDAGEEEASLTHPDSKQWVFTHSVQYSRTPPPSVSGSAMVRNVLGTNGDKIHNVHNNPNLPLLSFYLHPSQLGGSILGEEAKDNEMELHAKSDHHRRTVVNTHHSSNSSSIPPRFQITSGQLKAFRAQLPGVPPLHSLGSSPLLRIFRTGHLSPTRLEEAMGASSLRLYWILHRAGAFDYDADEQERNSLDRSNDTPFTPSLPSSPNDFRHLDNSNLSRNVRAVAIPPRLRPQVNTMSRTHLDEMYNHQNFTQNMIGDLFNYFFSPIFHFHGATLPWMSPSETNTAQKNFENNSLTPARIKQSYFVLGTPRPEHDSFNNPRYLTEYNAFLAGQKRGEPLDQEKYYDLFVKPCLVESKQNLDKNHQQNLLQQQLQAKEKVDLSLLEGQDSDGDDNNASNKKSLINGTKGSDNNQVNKDNQTTTHADIEPSLELQLATLKEQRIDEMDRITFGTLHAIRKRQNVLDYPAKLATINENAIVALGDHGGRNSNNIDSYALQTMVIQLPITNLLQAKYLPKFNPKRFPLLSQLTQQSSRGASNQQKSSNTTTRFNPLNGTLVVKFKPLYKTNDVVSISKTNFIYHRLTSKIPINASVKLSPATIAVLSLFQGLDKDLHTFGAEGSEPQQFDPTKSLSKQRDGYVILPLDSNIVDIEMVEGENDGGNKTSNRNNNNNSPSNFPKFTLAKSKKEMFVDLSNSDGSPSSPQQFNSTVFGRSVGLNLVESLEYLMVRTGTTSLSRQYNNPQKAITSGSHQQLLVLNREDVFSIRGLEGGYKFQNGLHLTQQKANLNLPSTLSINLRANINGGATHHPLDTPDVESKENMRTKQENLRVGALLSLTYKPLFQQLHTSLYTAADMIESSLTSMTSKSQLNHSDDSDGDNPGDDSDEEGEVGFSQQQKYKELERTIKLKKLQHKTQKLLKLSIHNYSYQDFDEILDFLVEVGVICNTGKSDQGHDGYLMGTDNQHNTSNDAQDQANIWSSILAPTNLLNSPESNDIKVDKVTPLDVALVHKKNDDETKSTSQKNTATTTTTITTSTQIPLSNRPGSNTLRTGSSSPSLNHHHLSSKTTSTSSFPQAPAPRGTIQQIDVRTNDNINVNVNHRFLEMIPSHLRPKIKTQPLVPIALPIDAQLLPQLTEIGSLFQLSTNELPGSENNNNTSFDNINPFQRDFALSSDFSTEMSAYKPVRFTPVNNAQTIRALRSETLSFHLKLIDETIKDLQLLDYNHHLIFNDQTDTKSQSSVSQRRRNQRKKSMSLDNTTAIHDHNTTPKEQQPYQFQLKLSQLQKLFIQTGHILSSFSYQIDSLSDDTSNMIDYHPIVPLEGQHPYLSRFMVKKQFSNLTSTASTTTNPSQSSITQVDEKYRQLRPQPRHLQANIVPNNQHSQSPSSPPPPPPTQIPYDAALETLALPQLSKSRRFSLVYDILTQLPPDFDFRSQVLALLAGQQVHFTALHKSSSEIRTQKFLGRTIPLVIDANKNTTTNKMTDESGSIFLTSTNPVVHVLATLVGVPVNVFVSQVGLVSGLRQSFVNADKTLAEALIQRRKLHDDNIARIRKNQHLKTDEELKFTPPPDLTHNMTEPKLAQLYAENYPFALQVPRVITDDEFFHLRALLAYQASRHATMRKVNDDYKDDEEESGNQKSKPSGGQGSKNVETTTQYDNLLTSYISLCIEHEIYPPNEVIEPILRHALRVNITTLDTILEACSHFGKKDLFNEAVIGNFLKTSQYVPYQYLFHNFQNTQLGSVIHNPDRPLAIFKSLPMNAYQNTVQTMMSSTTNFNISAIRTKTFFEDICTDINKWKIRVPFFEPVMALLQSHHGKIVDPKKTQGLQLLRQILRFSPSSSTRPSHLQPRIHSGQYNQTNGTMATRDDILDLVPYVENNNNGSLDKNDIITSTTNPQQKWFKRRIASLVNNTRDNKNRLSSLYHPAQIDHLLTDMNRSKKKSSDLNKNSTHQVIDVDEIINHEVGQLYYNRNEFQKLPLIGANSIDSHSRPVLIHDRYHNADNTTHLKNNISGQGSNFKKVHNNDDNAKALSLFNSGLNTSQLLSPEAKGPHSQLESLHRYSLSHLSDVIQSTIQMNKVLANAKMDSPIDHLLIHAVAPVFTALGRVITMSKDTHDDDDGVDDAVGSANTTNKVTGKNNKGNKTLKPSSNNQKDKKNKKYKNTKILASPLLALDPELINDFIDTLLDYNHPLLVQRFVSQLTPLRVQKTALDTIFSDPVLSAHFSRSLTDNIDDEVASVYNTYTSQLNEFNSNIANLEAYHYVMNDILTDLNETIVPRNFTHTVHKAIDPHTESQIVPHPVGFHHIPDESYRQFTPLLDTYPGLSSANGNLNNYNHGLETLPGPNGVPFLLQMLKNSHTSAELIPSTPTTPRLLLKQVVERVNNDILTRIDQFVHHHNQIQKRDQGFGLDNEKGQENINLKTHNFLSPSGIDAVLSLNDIKKLSNDNDDKSNTMKDHLKMKKIPTVPQNSINVGFNADQIFSDSELSLFETAFNARQRSSVQDLVQKVYGGPEHLIMALVDVVEEQNGYKVQNDPKKKSHNNKITNISSPSSLSSSDNQSSITQSEAVHDLEVIQFDDNQHDMKYLHQLTSRTSPYDRSVLYQQPAQLTSNSVITPQTAAAMKPHYYYLLNNAFRHKTDELQIREHNINALYTTHLPAIVTPVDHAVFGVPASSRQLAEQIPRFQKIYVLEEHTVQMDWTHHSLPKPSKWPQQIPPTSANLLDFVYRYNSAGENAQKSSSLTFVERSMQSTMPTNINAGFPFSIAATREKSQRKIVSQQHNAIRAGASEFLRNSPLARITNALEDPKQYQRLHGMVKLLAEDPSQQLSFDQTALSNERKKSGKRPRGDDSQSALKDSFAINSLKLKSNYPGETLPSFIDPVSLLNFGSFSRNPSPSASVLNLFESQGVNLRRLEPLMGIESFGTKSLLQQNIESAHTKQRYDALFQMADASLPYAINDEYNDGIYNDAMKNFKIILKHTVKRLNQANHQHVILNLLSHITATNQHIKSELQMNAVINNVVGGDWTNATVENGLVMLNQFTKRSHEIYQQYSLALQRRRIFLEQYDKVRNADDDGINNNTQAQHHQQNAITSTSTTKKNSQQSNPLLNSFMSIRNRNQFAIPTLRSFTTLDSPEKAQKEILRRQHHLQLYLTQDLLLSLASIHQLQHDPYTLLENSSQSSTDLIHKQRKQSPLLSPADLHFPNLVLKSLSKITTQLPLQDITLIKMHEMFNQHVEMFGSDPGIVVDIDEVKKGDDSVTQKDNNSSEAQQQRERPKQKKDRANKIINDPLLPQLSSTWSPVGLSQDYLITTMMPGLMSLVLNQKYDVALRVIAMLSSEGQFSTPFIDQFLVNMHKDKKKKTSDTLSQSLDNSTSFLQTFETLLNPSPVINGDNTTEQRDQNETSKQSFTSPQASIRLAHNHTTQLNFDKNRSPAFAILDLVTTYILDRITTAPKIFSKKEQGEYNNNNNNPKSLYLHTPLLSTKNILNRDYVNNVSKLQQSLQHSSRDGDHSKVLLYQQSTQDVPHFAKMGLGPTPQDNSLTVKNKKDDIVDESSNTIEANHEPSTEEEVKENDNTEVTIKEKKKIMTHDEVKFNNDQEDERTSLYEGLGEFDQISADEAKELLAKTSTDDDDQLDTPLTEENEDDQGGIAALFANGSVKTPVQPQMVVEEEQVNVEPIAPSLPTPRKRRDVSFEGLLGQRTQEESMRVGYMNETGLDELVNPAVTPISSTLNIIATETSLKSRMATQSRKLIESRYAGANDDQIKHHVEGSLHNVDRLSTDIGNLTSTALTTPQFTNLLRSTAANLQHHLFMTTQSYSVLMLGVVKNIEDIHKAWELYQQNSITYKTILSQHNNQSDSLNSHSNHQQLLNNESQMKLLLNAMQRDLEEEVQLEDQTIKELNNFLHIKIDRSNDKNFSIMATATTAKFPLIPTLVGFKMPLPGNLDARRYYFASIRQLDALGDSLGSSSNKSYFHSKTNTYDGNLHVDPLDNMVLKEMAPVVDQIAYYSTKNHTKSHMEKSMMKWQRYLHQNIIVNLEAIKIDNDFFMGSTPEASDNEGNDINDSDHYDDAHLKKQQLNNTKKILSHFSSLPNRPFPPSTLVPIELIPSLIHDNVVDNDGDEEQRESRIHSTTNFVKKLLTSQVLFAPLSPNSTTTNNDDDREDQGNVYPQISQQDIAAQQLLFNHSITHSYALPMKLNEQFYDNVVSESLIVHSLIKSTIYQFINSTTAQTTSDFNVIEEPAPLSTIWASLPFAQTISESLWTQSLTRPLAPLPPLDFMAEIELHQEFIMNHNQNNSNTTAATKKPPISARYNKKAILSHLKSNVTFKHLLSTSFYNIALMMGSNFDALPHFSPHNEQYAPIFDQIIETVVSQMLSSDNAPKQQGTNTNFLPCRRAVVPALNNISELLTDGAIALSIAAYPYVLKQNQQNGTQQQQHPNTQQLLQSRDLLFPPQHPFRSLVDQALHNPLLPEAVLDQDNNTNDKENNHSKDQFLPSVDYNKFTKSLYSHYLPAVAGSIETVVRVGGQLSEGNDSNDQIATASTTITETLQSQEPKHSYKGLVSLNKTTLSSLLEHYEDAKGNLEGDVNESGNNATHLSFERFLYKTQHNLIKAKKESLITTDTTSTNESQVSLYQPSQCHEMMSYLDFLAKGHHNNDSNLSQLGQLLPLFLTYTSSSNLKYQEVNGFVNMLLIDTLQPLISSLHHHDNDDHDIPRINASQRLTISQVQSRIDGILGLLAGASTIPIVSTANDTPTLEANHFIPTPMIFSSLLHLIFTPTPSDGAKAIMERVSANNNVNDQKNNVHKQQSNTSPINHKNDSIMTPSIDQQITMKSAQQFTIVMQKLLRSDGMSQTMLNDYYNQWTGLINEFMPKHINNTNDDNVVKDEANTTSSHPHISPLLSAHGSTLEPRHKKHNDHHNDAPRLPTRDELIMQMFGDLLNHPNALKNPQNKRDVFMVLGLSLFRAMNKKR